MNRILLATVVFAATIGCEWNADGDSAWMARAASLQHQFDTLFREMENNSQELQKRQEALREGDLAGGGSGGSPSEQGKEVIPESDPAEPRSESPWPAGVRLQMFTFSACSFCQQWKATELPKLTGVPFDTPFDIGPPNAAALADPNHPDHQKALNHKYCQEVAAKHGVTNFPTFFIVHDGKILKRISGYQSAETLTRMARDAGNVQASRWSFNGHWTVSREYAIQHLLNAPAHQGRHTEDELRGMTNEQLNTLHENEHDALENGRRRAA